MRPGARHGDSSAARTGALVAAAAVAALAACSSEAETFSLSLTWSQSGSQACPKGDDEVSSCRDIHVTCAAKMLVRIVPEDGGVPLYRHCYDLPATLDACAVRDVEIVPSEPIPNQMVRVQVGVWSVDQLANQLPVDNDGCPDDVAFDGVGQPLLDSALLPPALGGEIHFPVGDRYVAEVELGCPQYPLLDTIDCRLGDPIVEATVLDTGTWGRVDDEDALDARFGKMSDDDVNGGVRLAASDLSPLAFRSGGEALWSGQVAHDLPEIGCLDIDPSQPGSTRIAVCHQMPLVLNGDPIAIEGYLIDRAFLSRVLQSKGLGPDQFPREGLVLGFVIDHNRAPAANVVVSSPGNPTIQYPNDTLTGVTSDKTSSAGLFISTDALPRAALWEAESASGLGEVQARRGGIIANHVTVVVLQLISPVGGKPTR